MFRSKRAACGTGKVPVQFLGAMLPAALAESVISCLLSTVTVSHVERVDQALVGAWTLPGNGNPNLFS